MIWGMDPSFPMASFKFSAANLHEPLARSGSKSDRVSCIKETNHLSLRHSVPLKLLEPSLNENFLYIYILLYYLSIYIYTLPPNLVARSTRSWGFAPWLRCNLWGFAPEIFRSIWRMGWPASWELRPLLERFEVRLISARQHFQAFCYGDVAAGKMVEPWRKNDHDTSTTLGR